MPKITLKDLGKAMRKIDICMMTTRQGRDLDSRPMSNNRDVHYDGTSYFFTDGSSRVVRELERDPEVNLAYVGKKKWFISIAGKAKLVRDRARMEEHWTKDLGVWFEDGLDTPGLTMIEVVGEHARYWHQGEEGELMLRKKRRGSGARAFPQSS